jgi:hypothetical protein
VQQLKNFVSTVQYRTDSSRRLMSKSGYVDGPWRNQKAKQGLRMAKDATDPLRCINLQAERMLWLQLAAKIEGGEVLPFGPEPD